MWGLLRYSRPREGRGGSTHELRNADRHRSRLLAAARVVAGRSRARERSVAAHGASASGRAQRRGLASRARRGSHALRRIARGSVRSYVGVATDVGAPRGMRAVGMANAKNPLALVVPCHRVIETDMGLGGYTPGVHIKRYLLALEGVRVDNERVQPGQITLI
ncbi:MAG TPA: methylated-DNA--[protein]-cysteine S-methyltransferase [Polyangiales bacterium]